MHKLEIYTDGGCYNHGPRKGHGSSSFVVISEDSILYEGTSRYKDTTNNRMEYTALINALHLLMSLDRMNKYEIFVYSDSEILVKTMNIWLKQWKSKNLIDKKANSDLIKKMDSITEFIRGTGNIVNYTWVKGHSNNKWNNYCDRKCTESLRIDDPFWK